MQKRPFSVLAIAFAAVSTLAACNDEAFLTEVPEDFVAPENFYRNQGDALAGVNAVYATFITGTGDGYYGRNFPMVVEFPTEMLTTRLSATNERTRFDNYSWTPGHSYLLSTWSGAYQAINRANAVINRVPGIEMDATLRSRIVGEAKFLRALHYFNLVRLWGDVPLRLQETTSLNNLEMPRTPAAEVYAQIIADLESAIETLPSKSGYAAADHGRATRGAARTLLGKVYLQRGATGVGTAADFASAEAVLRQVVTSGEYGLAASHLVLFDVYGGTINENNNEVIFDIQNVRAPGLGGRLGSHMAPTNTAPHLGASTNGSFAAEYVVFVRLTTIPTTPIPVDTAAANSITYAATDLRRSQSWVLSWNKGGTMVTWSPTASNTTNLNTYASHTPFPRKYLDHLMTGTGVEEPNYILLRYADVLLMLAEAINEQAGPTTEAVEFVNMVRRRANLGNLSATTLTKATFKNVIFQERRWELMGEFHGHFDSQRHWEWATSRIEANIALGRASGQGNRYPKTAAGETPTDITHPKYYHFPIPQGVIDRNPLIEQNEHWR